MNANEKRTYRVEMPTGSVSYLTCDMERGTVEYAGRSVTMPYGRLMDFLHTAELLGMNVGEV